VGILRKAPEQLELFEPRTDYLMLENARRFHSAAHAVALALDLGFPIYGRTWRNMCCSCLERADPMREAPSHRLSFQLWGTWPGDCWSCPYSGCDVLVAAVRVELYGYSVGTWLTQPEYAPA
jgi:hypothetical protein